MQTHRPIPITRDLILLGGGHAHALILRRWAMAPLPGVQVTLINPDAKAPYTGMLPGFVAGHYGRGDLDIDLVRLARQANARLVIDRATGIDLQSKRVHLADAPDLAYDTLSIDVGITSALTDLPGAQTHLTPAKPLGPFASAWSGLIAAAKAGDFRPRILVLGGGVGGVELALAMAYRLRKEVGDRATIHLVEAAPTLLREVNQTTRKTLIKALHDAKVQTLLNTKIVKFSDDGAHTALDGSLIAANFVVSAAGARPYAWLADTGLAHQDGYIAVNAQLEALNAPGVFAVGDCAHLTYAPRPKAGVYAVRQAPVLFHNLRAHLSGGRSRTYAPQKDYLKLISLGTTSAATDKWGIGISGDWVWRWKNQIDQDFMRQFRTPIKRRASKLPKPRAQGVAEYMQAHETPCGACGAKLAQAPLMTGLGVSISAGDDAAIIRKGDAVEVFSTDHLRAISPDPFTLAKLAAIHALGDVWAMGARPETVLSQVILPPLSTPKQAEMLREITLGAREIIEACGAQLVGGHTSTGAELSIGFSVNGSVDADPIQHAGAQCGDVIILTKPIGTGVMLAGEMQQMSDGDDYLTALQTMLRPQAIASQLLAPAATAMTDVTGFGLAGHLLNILSASGVAAELNRSAIPILPGALSLADRNIRSTLWASNAAVADRISMSDGALRDLMFDPQTCGGLLATLPRAQWETIMAAFAAQQEPIWRIGQISAGQPFITVTD